MKYLLLISIAMFIIACDDDDNGTSPSTTNSFYEIPDCRVTRIADQYSIIDFSYNSDNYITTSKYYETYDNDTSLIFSDSIYYIDPLQALTKIDNEMVLVERRGDTIVIDKVISDLGLISQGYLIVDNEGVITRSETLHQGEITELIERKDSGDSLFFYNYEKDNLGEELKISGVTVYVGFDGKNVPRDNPFGLQYPSNPLKEYNIYYDDPQYPEGYEGIVIEYSYVYNSKGYPTQAIKNYSSQGSRDTTFYEYICD